MGVPLPLKLTEFLSKDFSFYRPFFERHQILPTILVLHDLHLGIRGSGQIVLIR